MKPNNGDLAGVVQRLAPFNYNLANRRLGSSTLRGRKSFFFLFPFSFFVITLKNEYVTAIKKGGARFLGSAKSMYYSD